MNNIIFRAQCVRALKDYGFDVRGANAFFMSKQKRRVEALLERYSFPYTVFKDRRGFWFTVEIIF
jgi:hypothetical protein